MNDVVYALAEQAVEYALLNPDEQSLQAESEDGSVVEVPKAFIDQFARLIIEHCVALNSEVHELVSNASDDYNEGREMGITVYANSIAKLLDQGEE